MTEEIINSDGSRNWEANILLDNIKRLEQENFALTQESQQKSQTICDLKQENKELKEKVKPRENELANMAEQANMRINTYRSALEDIQKAIKSYDLAVDNGASVDTLYTIRKIINEVLGC